MLEKKTSTVQAHGPFDRSMPSRNNGCSSQERYLSSLIFKGDEDGDEGEMY